MMTVTRKFQFCAGHRVLNHESKCAHPHGHNYEVLVTFDGELDSLGRVIDFSEIKKRIGTWIDINWDHKFIVFKEDSDLITALSLLKSPFYISPFNPTAENLAKYLLTIVVPELFPELHCKSIKIWETPNCFAEVINENRSI